MPGFNAATVVEPLDYTLVPFVNKSGQIKEPSDRQIADFLEGLKTVMRDADKSGINNENLADDADPAAMLAALDQLSGDALVQVLDDLTGLFATLCSGEPAKTDLLAMPLRHRTAFFAWLMSEVVSPEGGTVAGTLPAAGRPLGLAG
jgi:hypothetical protein